MIGDRPTFAMVTPAEDADARRIVSVDTFRAVTGLTTTDLSDEAAELMLDGVLADSARSCKLARAGAYPLTLAQEVVSATWVDASAMGYNWVSTYLPGGRGHQLLLPWRAPITLIEITEDETELVEDTDFRYLGAGVIERLSGGSASCWPTSGIVVEYTAGWLVDDETFPVPADLVSAICDQVRLKYNQRGTDFTLRSEDVPGVWSGSYNVPGGDAISMSGLMRPLEDALAPYRAPPSFA